MTEEAEERRIIAAAVRKHLARHPFNGITLAVLDDEMRKDNDWWRVPVQPNRRFESIIPYYDLLARVEDEIDEEEGLNILLVPALPE